MTNISINGQRLRQGLVFLKHIKVNCIHKDLQIDFFFYFIICIEFNRYEQWTAPEYYRSANSNFQNNEEKRKKFIELENRRKKLKELLDTENKQYAEEIEGIDIH